MRKEVNAMEKTTTMNLRVNPAVKQQAEDVLKQLGVPMATAVDMFLRQIALTGSIPFAIALPKAPDCVNADKMTAEQLHSAIQAGMPLLPLHSSESSTHEEITAYRFQALHFGIWRIFTTTFPRSWVRRQRL